VSVRKRKLKHGYVWQVQWRVGGKQYSRQFDRKDDADALEAQIKLDRRRTGDAPPPPSNVTFETFVQEFQRMRRGLRPTTIRRQDGIISKHLVPYLGALRLPEVKHATITTLVAKWDDAGLAANTIRNHRQLLSQIFKDAYLQELIPRNPVDGIRVPKATQKEMRVLNEEERCRLLDACDDLFGPLIHTALATGMRFSELRALKWSDVDFQDARIFVRESKTAKGVRDITVEPVDLEILRAHQKSCRDQFGATESVFLGIKGKPTNYGNFTKRYFLPLLDQIGLGDVRFHDLRKTHATFLFMEGFDPVTITQRMGHRSIQTTMKYYIKANEIMKRAAAIFSSKHMTNVLLPRKFTPRQLPKHSPERRKVSAPRRKIQLVKV
jgi:integrase